MGLKGRRIYVASRVANNPGYNYAAEEETTVGNDAHISASPVRGAKEPR